MVDRESKDAISNAAVGVLDSRLFSDKDRCNLEFDLEGVLLSETRDAEAYARFGAGSDLGASAPSGERYSIRSGALVRVHPPPETPLVPALRRPLALFVDHLPFVTLLVFAGAVGLIGGVALTSRRRDAPAAPVRCESA